MGQANSIESSAILEALSTPFKPLTNKYEAKTYIQAIELLEKYGICYIPDVLTDIERINMIDGTWSFFEHITKNDITPISRYDKNTWSSFESLRPALGMMYHHWHVGHSQHLWDLRQNEKIIEINARMLECNEKDLLVSFDGMSFLVPPEETDEHWFTRSQVQLHIDQKLSISYKDSLQSFVTANDIEEGDATIHFLEGSNRMMGEFIKEFGEFTDKEYVVFNQDHLDFFREKCKDKFMTCPAKSLVLWDPRLVHCGSNPKRGRKNPNTRCIAYLSYYPKQLSTQTDIEMKKLALGAMYTSNHYAHRSSYFPTYPSDVNKDNCPINKIPEPQLKKIGYSLAGYSDDEIEEIFS